MVGLKIGDVIIFVVKTVGLVVSSVVMIGVFFGNGGININMLVLKLIFWVVIVSKSVKL